MKRAVKYWIKYLKWLILNYNISIKLFNVQFSGEINKHKINDFWFSRFIKEKSLQKKKKIAFISVNGKPLILNFIPAKVKIFFTFENVNVFQSPWYKYKHLYLNNEKIHLSLGFNYLTYPNYLRFPYWIVTMFEPNESLISIQKKCNTIEHSREESIRENFCAFICREDYFGDRAKFAELISTIQPLKFPGRFRHNDDELITKYNNEKIDYLKQFKFNLCPENSNDKGYVTEKIFDAIKAGCIPIYWGSGNEPEPDVLNQSRILFLKLDGDNSKVLQKIKLLNENKFIYNEFISQPIFNSNAPEIIYGYFERLETKLREIIK